MAKEIHEQPEVIGHTLAHYLDPAGPMVAAGSAKLARGAGEGVAPHHLGLRHRLLRGLVGKYWFEKLARLPVETDVASELRYRDPVYPKDGAALFVSQSGETADTLAALRDAKAQGPDHHRGRQCGGKLHRARSRHRAADLCRAGDRRRLDQGLHLPAGGAGRASPSRRAWRAARSSDGGREAALRRAAGNAAPYRRIPEAGSRRSKALGEEIAKARDVLYLGRGPSFPLALEGALKLKEISYIHAEGYAAGEMKHGPIALIDENVPIIVIAPHDALFEKTISNMQEVMARGGKVLLISDARGIASAGEQVWATIEVPDADPFIAPLLYAIPVQLLAYYAAIAKGTDVDQPRNLAKSVTVE